MSAASLPERFATVAELEECLSEPTAEVAADLAKVPGDILVLGVAGKMGPTLARMAKRAAPEKRVVGVARFSDRGVRAGLEKRASRPSPATCWIAGPSKACRGSPTSFSWRR